MKISDFVPETPLDWLRFALFFAMLMLACSGRMG